MWAGWTKGFINGMTDLVIWLGSLIIGFIFYQNVAEQLYRFFPSMGVWAFPLAFWSQ
jgi:uncharacterized membrane protein required for colicin V production